MSESAQLDDSDSKSEIEDLVEEANLEMDVDSVFETYDANSDGRVEHSEYVAVHKSEVSSGGVSSFIDRLLDDSPELRGQRLWVMFALSVLLVAAMNAYAMVREPELVKIEDLVEHNNEVVSIEGIVLSWVEDPYSSGEDRVNIIIEDDTGVAQLRWYRYGDIPMLGTKVTATGDVIEYNGRIWLQALGSGALSWDESDTPEAPVIGIATIAKDPDEFIGQSFTITGYISKSVDPEATFTSLDLRDHPEYGSHDHQMNMIIHSATGKWLESGQKVEVTAIIEYSEKFLQWTIHTQGPEIRVDRDYIPTPMTISWADYETWSYNSNENVVLAGVISDGNIVDPVGDMEVCLINSDNLSEYEGQTVYYSGRLIWSDMHSGWCIEDPNVDPNPTYSSLLELTSNPENTFSYITNYTVIQIYGYSGGSLIMDNNESTKIQIASGLYDPEDTQKTIVKMDAYIPLGEHTGWLESDQQITINATVSWNYKSSEFQLNAISMNLIGPPPEPVEFSLVNTDSSEAALPKFWDMNKITKIEGELVIIDGITYLQDETDSGYVKIRINVQDDSIGLNQDHEGLDLTWTGRLIEVADRETLAHYYVLDNADVTDEDGNGIADDAEDF